MFFISHHNPLRDPNVRKSAKQTIAKRSEATTLNPNSDACPFTVVSMAVRTALAELPKTWLVELFSVLALGFIRASEFARVYAA